MRARASHGARRDRRAPVALLAARLRPLLERLPMQPPALALAAALNRWLLPRLPPMRARRCPAARSQIAVTDLGLVLALQLDARGFRLAPARAPSRCASPRRRRCTGGSRRGADDADRLFFERALVMEGDTEIGLILEEHARRDRAAVDMNLTERLLQALAQRGATEIFGIPGDFALPLFREIEKSGLLPLHTLSHEPAVGFAADAARACAAASAWPR